MFINVLSVQTFSPDSWSSVGLPLYLSGDLKFTVPESESVVGLIYLYPVPYSGDIRSIRSSHSAPTRLPVHR